MHLDLTDDEAAALTEALHDIVESEAHEGLARLLRFAQFAADNWAGLTRRR
jgi:hypothetical protein